ncbi:ABC transporter permease [Nocardioides marmotae]|uniref:ABC transporter permease subunit n=1 Tax=Nocardioides marmotae TaxID=2663857 RepID=A0A6I3ITU0_9ACTN|nr:ABC transporter permease [Nocardioides marmotae]MCR6030271.1 ABC transporter permease subunit [Gordonia jinghuaiqii]MBC9734438.1 ABC transporter permease [Nocardioides marmotae]MTB85538.1 ABC transporter permease subunit [Nocardioides marmotae]MTB93903.1 ABC transporter permease subunit [Nocardioides marmotae]QKE00224.1 ABC transporter permease [Nocardioides marmotae]
MTAITPTLEKRATATVIIKAGARRNDPYSVFQRKKRLGRALAWVAPVLVLLSWQISSDTGLVDKRTFTSPTEVGEAFWTLATNGVLFENLAVTVQRIGIGYVSGAVVGIVVGLALGWSILMRSAVRPMIRALQTAPTLGLFPLFMMIFGLGETAKYLIVAKGMGVLVALAVIDAVAAVPTAYIEAAKSLGCSKWAFFTEVILPASLERIITALRIGIGIGVLSTIGVEFIAANEGVGRIIWTSWNLFLPAQMWVGIITSCLLGVVGNMLVDLLQRLVMPWQREGDRVVS